MTSNYFKKLFEKLTEEDVIEIISVESTGQYSRKIWFLYEWLEQKQLIIPDLKMKNYVPLIDTKIQYAVDNGIKSPRHRIVNNLPGTIDFCPLVFKTPKIEQLITTDILMPPNRLNFYKIVLKIRLKTSSQVKLSTSKNMMSLKNI